MTIRRFVRKVKNNVLSYDEVEIRVREATSNDPWGASSTLMKQIAEDSFDRAKYPRMFAMVWKRLSDFQHLQHVLKALHLIDYLLRTAQARFIRDVRSRSKAISRLRKYKYYKDGVDIGADVRNKALAVYMLLMDDKLLQEERDKSQQTKGRFVGISSGSAQAMAPVSHQRQEHDPFSASTRVAPSSMRSGVSLEDDDDEDDDDFHHVQEEEEHGKSKKKDKKKKKKKKKKKSTIVSPPSGDAFAAGGDDDFDAAFGAPTPIEDELKDDVAATNPAQQYREYIEKHRDEEIVEEVDFDQLTTNPNEFTVDFLTSVPEAKRSEDDWLGDFSVDGQPEDALFNDGGPVVDGFDPSGMQAPESFGSSSDTSDSEIQKSFNSNWGEGLVNVDDITQSAITDLPQEESKKKKTQHVPRTKTINQIREEEIKRQQDLANRLPSGEMKDFGTSIQKQMGGLTLEEEHDVELDAYGFPVNKRAQDQQERRRTSNAFNDLGHRGGGADGPPTARNIQKQTERAVAMSHYQQSQPVWGATPPSSGWGYDQPPPSNWGGAPPQQSYGAPQYPPNGGPPPQQMAEGGWNARGPPQSMSHSPQPQVPHPQRQPAQQGWDASGWS